MRPLKRRTTRKRENLLCDSSQAVRAGVCMSQSSPGGAGDDGGAAGGGGGCDDGMLMAIDGNRRCCLALQAVHTDSWLWAQRYINNFASL